jgi:hypothetical protein
LFVVRGVAVAVAVAVVDDEHPASSMAMVATIPMTALSRRAEPA